MAPGGGHAPARRAVFLCYAPGTLIDTALGPRPVETLRPGEAVLTRDDGARPVLWAESSVQALDGLARDARPVLVSAGALGPGRPSHDLVVSPQHRIVVGTSGQCGDLSARPAFVPAKALAGRPGIRHLTHGSAITWVHFACARHHVVRANGCWSESLLLGPMAQRALSKEALRFLHDALPAPADPAYLNGPPALPCLTPGEVRRNRAKPPATAAAL